MADVNDTTSKTATPNAVMDPSQPSQSHLKMLDAWDVCRTCWDGTPSIRAAGEKYLPRYAREPIEEWVRRRDMTTFYNIYAHALQNIAARPFGKPLKLREATHESARLIEDNIDSEGTALAVYARRQFRDALVDGMVHTLVDFTFVPAGQTLAAVKRAGARPYFVHVRAHDLLAAYTAFIDGRRIVTHARLRETHTYLNGFHEVHRKRVRVLEPGYYQLWEQGGAGWTLIEEGEMVKSGGELWDRVPLETFYVGHPEHDFYIVPPFLDLAWKNIEHWQSSSAQRNILTKSRFPLLAASGMDASELEDADGRIVLGPHSILVSQDPGSKWYYVEPRGSAIEQGRKDLENLENQMLAMGIEPLRARQNNQVTATQTGVDEIKARSILEQWSYDFVDYLERCLGTALEWQGIYDGEIEIDLHADFSVNPNPAAELEVLLRARAQGDLSRPTLWAEFRRRDFLSTHFDAEVEHAQLEQDFMLGAQNTAYGTMLNSRAIAVGQNPALGAGSDPAAQDSFPPNPGDNAG